MATWVYDKLTEPFSVNEFKDRTLPFLEMKGDRYKARYSSFDTITFDSLVRFENTDLSIGLYFNSCQFQGPLVFTNVTANGYDDLLNPNSLSICFKNCTFHDVVQFNGGDAVIERTVLFEGSTFKKGLEVEYLNIGAEGLAIRSCAINEKLDLFNITTKQDVSLAGNTINTFVRLASIDCLTFTIVGNNIFNDKFQIRGGKFIRGIVFNDGLFKNEVKIYQAYSEKSGLTIIGSEFEKSVFVTYHSGKSQPPRGLHSFYFNDAKFNNGIYVNGTENVLSENPFVEKIELAISAELKGDIVFRNLHVGIIGITGYNNAANILLEHLYVNQLKIKGLINNAGLIFSMIRASYVQWYSDTELTLPRDNAIYIDDTNFGKAQFFQVDFSSFNKIIFHNNILTDISTSLVKWFSPDQLDASREKSARQLYRDAKKSKNKERITNETASLISTYRSKQEIYRQLKFASQKQGDIPQSLEFQANEMNYYRKVTNLRKPFKWSELLILWSSQTNDFGQNWLKAFSLLLLVSFISYLPIGLLNTFELDHTKFANSFTDVVTTLKIVFIYNIKNWLIILNPAHRIKDLNENIDALSSWIYFWDLLSRVIVSYFIFQVISAFRKFNK
jgi:hypothetical protein